jgi:hypothetical protein
MHTWNTYRECGPGATRCPKRQYPGPAPISDKLFACCGTLNRYTAEERAPEPDLLCSQKVGASQRVRVSTLDVRLRPRRAWERGRPGVPPWNRPLRLLTVRPKGRRASGPHCPAEKMKIMPLPSGPRVGVPPGPAVPEIRRNANPIAVRPGGKQQNPGPATPLGEGDDQIG